METGDYELYYYILLALTLVLFMIIILQTILMISIISKLRAQTINLEFYLKTSTSTEDPKSRRKTEELAINTTRCLLSDESKPALRKRNTVTFSPLPTTKGILKRSSIRTPPSVSNSPPGNTTPIYNSNSPDSRQTQRRETIKNIGSANFRSFTGKVQEVYMNQGKMNREELLDVIQELEDEYSLEMLVEIFASNPELKAEFPHIIIELKALLNTKDDCIRKAQMIRRLTRDNNPPKGSLVARKSILKSACSIYTEIDLESEDMESKNSESNEDNSPDTTIEEYAQKAIIKKTTTYELPPKDSANLANIKAEGNKKYSGFESYIGYKGIIGGDPVNVNDPRGGNPHVTDYSDERLQRAKFNWKTESNSDSTSTIPHGARTPPPPILTVQEPSSTYQYPRKAAKKSTFASPN